MSKHSERRRRYESTLRAVDANTGGPQPPAARETCIVRNRSMAGYDADAVRSTIRAAVDAGHLVRFEDHDGTTRLALSTNDQLRRLAQWAAERDPPNKRVVGLANRAMA